ncbi:MAG: S-adenosylmethionine:tRNA ribosyltransferase-isomerase, partial [bacterium]|nr:S-adenosylmethionine:tRNA ribosyltransferase-isomerase [bacterium]
MKRTCIAIPISGGLQQTISLFGRECQDQPVDKINRQPTKSAHCIRHLFFTMKFEKLLEQYDYQFPAELIAQTPASPRDSARLLVYDRNTKSMQHDIYKNILDYLPANAVLVLNQTKVIPARLTVTKPTGGTARILYISHDKNTIKVISDRKIEIDSTIAITKQVQFHVLDQQGQFYILKPLFKISNVYTLLEKYGQTPLPPYIKNPSLKGKKLHSEYNTVFAKQIGSVAAPTASLHFTKALLKKIERAGIEIQYITLHVNLGTFASLT